MQTSTSNYKTMAIVNTMAFLLVIITNYLAVSLPLNNKTTGQLADQYPNLFTPAGFTFSIWSVIYTFLLGFIIYQWIVPANNPTVASRVRGITVPFVINCLANAGWLFAWHYEQVALSVAIMLVMLVTLIIIHHRLLLALPWKPLRQKLWLDIPFSLYLGWISIATIANITAWLVDMNLQPFGISQITWAIVMAGAGTLIALWMILAKGNMAHGLVAVWALIGIIAARKAEAIDATNSIILFCYVFITLLVITIMFKSWRQLKQSTQLG